MPCSSAAGTLTHATRAMELLSSLAPVPVGLGATAVPPPLLNAEAQLLGGEATLTEDGENQVTQGRQRVVHNAFACEQELDTTAVSRDAWLSMAYLTLLDSLAIAVIWTGCSQELTWAIYPGSPSAFSIPGICGKSPTGSSRVYDQAVV